MRLLNENKDIENQKDLLTFVEKYINYGMPETVHDERVCRAERRSISDIHALFMNYNPESKVTYDDVIICLPLIKINYKNFYGDDMFVSIRYCSTPYKVVIFTAELGFSDWKFIPEIGINILIDNHNETEAADGISIDYVLDILHKSYGIPKYYNTRKNEILEQFIS